MLVSPTCDYFFFSGLFKHPFCRLMMSSLVWPVLVESFQGTSDVPLCHIVGMAGLVFFVSHLCEAAEQIIFSIGIS